LVLEEAMLEGKSLEELVGEALFKQLEVADLEAKGGAPPEALREVRARGRDLREEGLAQASGKAGAPHPRRSRR
jgi:hypothetical protein